MSENVMHQSVLGGSHQLHPSKGGRVFVRGTRMTAPDGRTLTGRDASLLIGVVQAPRRLDVERLHQVRLNTHLWVDVEHSRAPRAMYPEVVGEEDAGGVLSHQYARCLLPDAFEAFFRETMLPSDIPGQKWVYIIAPLATRPPALSQDGLYEFANDGRGFSHISSDIHVGEQPASILRIPQWGPNGEFGMSTSMEPNTFNRWLQGERERNMAREPEFRRFAELLEKRVPEQLVYTKAYAAQREAASREVIRQLMLERNHPPAEAMGAEPAEPAKPASSRRLAARP